MKNFILVICTVLLLISCGPGKSTVHDETLLEGSWTLSLITGVSFDGRTKPTITFDVLKNTVAGKNSCNSYSGTYTVKDSAMRFDSQTMMMTKMFCEGSIERQFMDALQRTDQFSIAEDGKVLSLLQENSVLLKFDKQ